jgi:hypothetical protein
MRRLLPLAPVLALLAVAAPVGAATWTAPATVSQTPHLFAGPLALAAGPGGATVVAWPWQDGTGTTARTGAAAAAHAPGATGAGPEHPAPDGLLDVAAYGLTRTVALAQTLAGGSGPTGAQNQRLALAYGRTDGSFSPPRTLATGPIAYRPQLAVDRDGRGLVAWIEVTRTSTGATRRIVRAVERDEHGRLGRATVLSGRGRADALAVAVGDGGDEVLAIAREGKVLARVRRPGRRWGSFFTLARADGATQWQLDAGADRRGLVQVVWRRHQLTRSGVPGRQALEAAHMSVGRFTFSAAAVVEPDGASSARLVPGPPGWALAYVEATPDGPRPVLRLAVGSPLFGPARFAAPAQGGLRGADVAYSPAAGWVVAWVQPVAGQDSDGLARAAAVPDGDPSAPFGPVEDVSPAEAVHEVRLSDDERGGGPLAIWVARPEGTGPGVPIAQIHTVVRSAIRRP